MNLLPPAIQYELGITCSSTSNSYHSFTLPVYPFGLMYALLHVYVCTYSRYTVHVVCNASQGLNENIPRNDEKETDNKKSEEKQ